ncbi:MAG: HAD-IB family phosphatase [Candidatus Micrarchaeia archaeon]
MSANTPEKEPDGIFLFFRNLLTPEKATVVIPCYNEEKTVGQVVLECLRSYLVSEVIVVDDGSTDGSAEAARQNGAHVIAHGRNKGKGAAIMAGARAAKNDALVFIDADLEDFSKDTVEKLVLPLINRECRICKSTFNRLGGRITDFTAKPLLKHIFSELELGQPLSGQFAIRKKLLFSLDVDADWGVDIAIMLSALKAGEKIVEVNIGELKHKHREHASVIKTAEEVSRTILQQAGFLARKHKLIAFDFDGTLVEGRSIDLIARRFGFMKQLAALRSRFLRGEISEKKLSESIAQALGGVNIADFEEAAGKVKKRKFAGETVNYLKRMGYKVVLVSYAFDKIINSVFKPQLFDAILCPELEVAENTITGVISIPRYRSSRRLFHKGKALRALMRRFSARPGQTIAVGNSSGDKEMFKAAGLSLAFSTRSLRFADERIKSLPEILIIAS